MDIITQKGSKMIKLYCIKINDQELKTINEKEYFSFLKANKKDVYSYTQVMIETSEDKLKNLIENYSVDELLRLWKKKKGIDEKTMYIAK